MERTHANGVRIACIGFGEAASAFVSGWRGVGPAAVSAYDRKTDDADAGIRDAKWADYAALDVAGAQTPAAALRGATLAVSLVTADQALRAATDAARTIAPGTLYLDGNSCAPGTKRKAAALIEAAGGRYVDMAVMAPVHPKLHRTPVLLSGPHTAEALAVLAPFGMAMRAAPGERSGEVGTASSIKMIRSVMMKGLEALFLECVLAGRKAGVDGIVLDSLEQTYPGFGWKQRAAYQQERVMTHGIRRAAEMREVALTVDELGLHGVMARAAVEWQQRVGALRLDAKAIGQDDYGTLADAILARLDPDLNGTGA